MKKFFILPLLLLSMLSFSSFEKNNASTITIEKNWTSVYICKGGSAYAYHSSSSCRGLNRCTHTIAKVSETDAVKKYGRKPCKVCY